MGAGGGGLRKRGRPPCGLVDLWRADRCSIAHSIAYSIRRSSLHPPSLEIGGLQLAWPPSTGRPPLNDTHFSNVHAKMTADSFSSAQSSLQPEIGAARSKQPGPRPGRGAWWFVRSRSLRADELCALLQRRRVGLIFRDEASVRDPWDSRANTDPHSREPAPHAKLRVAGALLATMPARNLFHSSDPPPNPR